MPQTGRTPLLDSRIAAGKCDCFASFRSGSLYDKIGGRLFAMTSATLKRNGVGIAYGGSLVASSILTLSTEGTIFIVCSPEYSADATSRHIIADASGAAPTTGFRMYLTPTNLLFGILAASGSKVVTAAYTTPWNTKTSYALTFKNNDNLIGYVNGAAFGVPTSLVGETYAPPAAATMTMGLRPGGSRALQETVFDVYVDKESLSAANIAILHDEIVNQIRYESQSMIVNSTFPTLGGDVYRACYGILAGEVTMSAGQSLGQLDALKVSTGTHKCSTVTYNGQLAKVIQCVTAGNIILPDPRPTLGTTWSYRYYDDSAAAWSTRTSATATVALDAASDIILWSTADNNTCLRKY